MQRTRSFNTLKREFELADVLDYVKTGVEAIIEDQVTSRFEAEELKVMKIMVYYCMRGLILLILVFKMSIHSFLLTELGLSSSKK